MYFHNITRCNYRDWLHSILHMLFLMEKLNKNIFKFLKLLETLLLEIHSQLWHDRNGLERNSILDRLPFQELYLIILLRYTTSIRSIVRLSRNSSIWNRILLKRNSSFIGFTVFINTINPVKTESLKSGEIPPLYRLSKKIIVYQDHEHVMLPFYAEFWYR